MGKKIIYMFEREISTNTVKYYYLAISEFLPYINDLKKVAPTKVQKELETLIEMYEDIKGKILKLDLNMSDPNMTYDTEPWDIPISTLGFDDKTIEHFSQLTLRMLYKWKDEQKNLEEKIYRTEKDKKRLTQLKHFIWPLEAQFNNETRLFFKNKQKGPIIFPGEKENINQKSEMTININDNDGGIFPQILIDKMHIDIADLCIEFNFCYKNEMKNACLLLLRKILPIAIVRKFQQLNIEDQIKVDGDFLETKQLLGKAKQILSNKRLYDEIINNKIIIDAIQHIFTFKPDMLDVKGSANTIRVFLDDLFFNIEG